MADADVTRREVLTKAVYMTPVLVTLPVLLSFASAGSGHPSADSAGAGHPDHAGDDGGHRRGKSGKRLPSGAGSHLGQGPPSRYLATHATAQTEALESEAVLVHVSQTIPSEERQAV